MSDGSSSGISCPNWLGEMPSTDLLSVGIRWVRSATRAFSSVMGRFPLNDRFLSPITKKADVAEHAKALNHVGLLFNEPPGTAGLFFV